MSLSSCDPGPHRRPWGRIAISLRTLMILVLVIGGALGWKVRRAAIQRRAVTAIQAAGGEVLYDYQAKTPTSFQVGAEPWAPAWLRRLAGDEMFREAAIVWLTNSHSEPRITSRAIDALADLDDLRRLFVFQGPLDDTAVGKLAGLTRLRDLTLLDVPIATAGLAHLRRLPGLVNLSLRVQPGVLPGESLQQLAGMAGLEKIEIIGIKPIEVANLAPLIHLTRLKSLRLSSSPAAGGWFEDLRNLTDLQVLDLRETRATDADLRALATHPRLEMLMLDGTALTDAGLAHLGRLSALRTLILTSPDDLGQITDAGLAHLAGLKASFSLQLDAHLLSAVGFARLAALPLQHLTLTGLTANQEELARIATKRSLTRLDLEGSGVADSWLDLLKGQPTLETLGLGRTGITDEGIGSMTLLIPRVVSLNLDETALSDTALMRLATAPALRSVSARGTKMTAAGVAAFKAIRPGAHVEIGPIIPPPGSRSTTRP